MQVNQRRILRLKSPQQIILPNFHLRIVRYIHIVRVRVLRKLVEIPQLHRTVQPSRYENIAAAAESQAMDGFLVAAELSDEVTVGQVPDEHPTVGPGGRHIAAAHAEG